MLKDHKLTIAKLTKDFDRRKNLYYLTRSDRDRKLLIYSYKALYEFCKFTNNMDMVPQL